jgi:hypothetical protein
LACNYYFRNKAEYYRARDEYVAERALRRVWALRDICAGRYADLSYTDRVALVRLLTRLEELATYVFFLCLFVFLPLLSMTANILHTHTHSTRPSNWQSFCLSRQNELDGLLGAVFDLTREATLPVLRLLLLFLRAPVSSIDERKATSSSETKSDIEKQLGNVACRIAQSSTVHRIVDRLLLS